MTNLKQKPKVVSIIGGTGQLGQKFAKEFQKQGTKILISGRFTKLSNKDIASIGDVVIITVPINKTVQVVQEILPVLKSGAMLTDFTSVKIMPLQAMIKAKKDITIIGGHPLFGPSTEFKYQNFILCPERGNTYLEWYKKFLDSLGLNILQMNKEEHDKQMAVIQGLTHFAHISLGATLQKNKYNLEKAKKIATPVYLMHLYGVGRILAQDATLYTDIQKYNPYAKKIIKQYKKSVDKLYHSIKQNKKKKFHNTFQQSKKYFGKITEESVQTTDELIKTLSKYLNNDK